MSPHAHVTVSGSRLDPLLAALGLRSEPTANSIAYTVLPGREGPRWLLPNRYPLLQTVLAEWRPYSLAGRLHWLLIRLAARVGALRFLPGVEQIHLPASAGSDLLRHIGFEADAQPPAVYVGTPTVTQKLVAFLVAPGQKLQGVVKLPLTAAARTCLRDEADTLKAVEGKCRAPRLLHYSPGSGAIMQEYLCGEPGSRRCKPAYIGLLLDLVRKSDTISLREYGSRLRERLRNQSAYADRAGCIDSALACLQVDADVPAVIVHGDFAPWNIRELRDGTCAVVDWEWTELRGLPLYDLCHFFYIQTRSFTPGTLFYPAFLQEGSWRAYCGALQIEPALVPRLAAAFLLELLARSWESDRIPSAQFCLGQLEKFVLQVKIAAE